MQTQPQDIARQIRELRDRAQRVTTISSPLSAAAILGLSPHTPIRRIP